MTIELGFLTLILALYALGAWLDRRERAGHPPRYEGRYRTPCSDVTNLQGAGVRRSGPIEFCN